MPSNNAIYTREDNEHVRQARAKGRRVLDLRDDGKWHDMSQPRRPGKGSNRRPSAISAEEWERRWQLAFGGDDEDAGSE